MNFTQCYSIRILCMLILFAPAILAEPLSTRTIETGYYTLYLPDFYRYTLKQARTKGSEASLIAFDNRLLKTSSIVIDASSNKAVDIEGLKTKTMNTIEEKKGLFEILSCSNQCKAYYGFVADRRRNEHVILVDSPELQFHIRYLAEDQTDKEKAFILALTRQIYPAID